MRTQVTDYTNTNELYRIPQPTGAGDTADIEAAIIEGEQRFEETFGISVSEADKDAVCLFVFATWMRLQSLKKTAQGAGARVRFNQAETRNDQERRVAAYNRACVLVGQPKKKLKRIFNY